MARLKIWGGDDFQRKPGYRRSIIFSIAYVRVCEWAKDPNKFPRPKPDELDKAEYHAKHISDSWILEKIQECRAYYAKVESTPTPKLPKPTPEAERSAEEITGKIRRQRTLPYPIEFLTEAERLDWELEQFLADLEEMEARGL